MATTAIARLASGLRRSALGRNKLLTHFYGELVVRLHGSNEAKVGEFVVRFDPRDRYIARKLIVSGGYEEGEIAGLCALIKPGDVVLDVGANIGLYTLAMSRAAGDTGTVVAFEPDPDNLEILKHNVAANGCRNVTIVGCGLDDHDGTRSLYQQDANRGYLTFADVHTASPAVSVRVRTGDSVLAELNLKAPRVAKIDVEGAEPLVLTGLTCRPQYVQFEYVPMLIRRLGLDPLDFLEKRVSQGYALSIIDRDSQTLLPTSAKDLASEADRSGLHYNVLATLTP